MHKINMKNAGLSEQFIQEAALYKELYVGRIVSQYKNVYKVITEYGELTAEISGKFRYKVKDLSQYPAVGDFVMLDKTNDRSGNAIIHAVLTRKSIFERKAAGTANDVQVIAVNIDTVFICMALNQDFNVRRVERYLSIAWDSGAIPVIVLTKSDISKDISANIAQLDSVAIGVDVLVTNSRSEKGHQAVEPYIDSGKTVAFVGSSGVGKSTLINRILGADLLYTKETRNDDKGRHTTTRRELIVLPDRGALIDTPGMRELGIESASVSKSFADIDKLAENCRFHDCSHEKEPNCAVLKAIQNGVILSERLVSYQKLKKEAKYEGLNSKQIETEKMNAMFGKMGGMKNVRKMIKEKNKRKR
ncbi:ribosome small subunit-dependent GTPase A [Domibacillus mangrovi]|uniref:Small ribosomal subunit biogenesis GTPase RsgA n=1 Tax=Domibacillus mangrovi TaxID=1714354 RepID=A0A1Q5P4Z2_9BACI|nr:ribosome small subunit-dependent GTPase A [Domibacillus mangrovi]OKL37326.1 ribosome small subunit-dependent GTPase A [Domibacillus mangrovi]